MGEGIRNLNKVTFTMASGEEISMYANDFSKIEITRESQYGNFLDMPCIIKDNYSINFKVKNVTRKRFIKLVMSFGFQKNTAIELAKYCFKRYGYYNFLNFMLNDLSMVLESE